MSGWLQLHLITLRVSHRLSAVLRSGQVDHLVSSPPHHLSRYSLFNKIHISQKLWLTATRSHTFEIKSRCSLHLGFGFLTAKMDMDNMLGGGGGAIGQFPLEQWFYEMPVCTRWWTAATVATSLLVQCQIITPFQLFYSFRAVFVKNQVCACVPSASELLRKYNVTDVDVSSGDCSPPSFTSGPYP